MSKENHIKKRDEQDTAWKEILDSQIKDCIEYCIPDLAKLIDWEKPIVSLDKELQSITKSAITGKRLLDKLFQVFLKNGQEQWILIHVEVQGTKEEEFPKRMFTYAYRIWDKYQQFLVSCAILTDDCKEWRPNEFEVGFHHSYLRCGFIIIKLLDYQSKESELEKSNNPFACVILAQLTAIKAKSQSPQQRHNIKFALTRRLYEKGFSKKEIDNLYIFIDWLIGLPHQLEVNYLEKVYELEESLKMSYVSNAERFGIEKGIAQEKMQSEKEKLKIAKRLLDIGLAPVLVSETVNLPLDQIKNLELYPAE